MHSGIEPAVVFASRSRVLCILTREMSRGGEPYGMTTQCNYTNVHYWENRKKRERGTEINREKQSDRDGKK